MYPQGGQGKSSIEAHALAKKIDNYCVDGAQDYGESSEFSNREEETILFLCSGGVDEGEFYKRFLQMRLYLYLIYSSL